MKNIFNLLLIAITIFLVSCEKEYDVVLDGSVINVKSAGKLIVKLVDQNSQPIPNQSLKLYAGSSLNIDELTTNGNGEIDFGSLNEGYYTVRGINIEDNGVKYSFSQLAQVVTSETKTITITPSDFSGTVNITALQTLPTSASGYTTPNELKTGMVALIPRNSIITPTTSLKDVIIIEKELDGATNKITFNKVPFNITYEILFYTDSIHYSYGYDERYLTQYGDLYEEYFNLGLDEEINITAVAQAQKLFDIKGTVTINSYELVPTSYYNYNTLLLSYGHCLLIPYENGSYISNYASLNDLISVAIDDITLSETNNPITFKDVPIGNYYVAYYTDSDHYTFGSGSSSTTSLTLVYASTSNTSQNIYARRQSLKDSYLDITYYLRQYDSNTYQYIGKENVNVYIVRQDDFYDLYSSERSNEDIIKGIALSSGTSNSEGKATISTLAYEDIYVIYFDTDGSTDYTRKEYYSVPTSDVSITVY